MTRASRWVSLLAMAACLGLASGCVPPAEDPAATRVAELDPDASAASLTVFSSAGPLRFDAAVEGELELQWRDGPEGPELLLHRMDLAVGSATHDGHTLHGAELLLSAPLSAPVEEGDHVAFERTETSFAATAAVDIVTVEHELLCAHALQGIVDEDLGLIDWGVTLYAPDEALAGRLEIAAGYPPP